MQKFKSHKVVEAAKIVSIEVVVDGSALLHVADGLDNIHVSETYLAKHEPQPGGYYVRYPDGYESFSPAEAFEDGYTAVDAYPTPVETLTTGQPKIATYRNLTQAEIDVMNLIKSFEGSIADLLATVHVHLQGQLVGSLNSEGATKIARRDRAQPERWAAMARTDFQTAFMKLTRAVAQPDSPL